MLLAMTDKCPGAPATLQNERASSLYEARSTYSAEKRLLYALFLVLYLLFWMSVQDWAACNPLQAYLERIYERYHAIASRRKLSFLSHGPISCPFLLYYTHYITIICYYTHYFKNQKRDLGANSLQKNCQSAHPPQGISQHTNKGQPGLIHRSPTCRLQW